MSRTVWPQPVQAMPKTSYSAQWRQLLETKTLEYHLAKPHKYAGVFCRFLEYKTATIPHGLALLASACHAGGRGFEPRPLRQWCCFRLKQCPVKIALLTKELRKGPVAQSVEQRTENPCVGGSIPPRATTIQRPAVLGWAFSFVDPPKHAGFPHMSPPARLRGRFTNEQVTKPTPPADLIASLEQKKTGASTNWQDVSKAALIFGQFRADFRTAFSGRSITV